LTDVSVAFDGAVDVSAGVVVDHNAGRAADVGTLTDDSIYQRIQVIAFASELSEGPRHSEAAIAMRTIKVDPST